ncbi:MAG: S-adenosylmethionine:tRNA ribosyltransferase-isomerase, partial [Christensenellales bacterium]
MSETLSTHDFYYELPSELIAQTPVEPRDSSRLLCYNKKTKEIQHKHFYDIIDFLEKGDLLVINNTRVIPARLFGKKEGKDTNFEVFLLKREDYKKWQVLVRPAR